MGVGTATIRHEYRAVRAVRSAIHLLLPGGEILKSPPAIRVRARTLTDGEPCTIPGRASAPAGTVTYGHTGSLAGRIRPTSLGGGRFRPARRGASGAPLAPPGAPRPRLTCQRPPGATIRPS